MGEFFFCCSYVNMVSLQFFVVSLLLFFVNTDAAPLDITLHQLTPTTVSISWEELIFSDEPNKSPYLLRSFDTDILTTKDTNMMFHFTPNIAYSFEVCRNNTHRQEFCTSIAVPFESQQNSNSFPKAFSIDAENIAIVFDSSFVQQDRVTAKYYLIEALGRDITGELGWVPVYTEKAHPFNDPGAIYSAEIPVIPGVSRLYRISRGQFRTNAFWFATQTRTYSGVKNPVQVFSFTPSSVVGTKNLASDSPLTINFDVDIP